MSGIKNHTRQEILDANEWLDSIEEAQDVARAKARARAEADRRRSQQKTGP
jgi:hypothetical protein